jgi:predicted DNA-binding transcriptional regulator AlpA
MMQGNNLGDDLLIGAPAIAAYLNVSERRIYHWGKQGYIPTFNIGPLVAARRSELDEALRKKGASWMQK